MRSKKLGIVLSILIISTACGSSTIKEDMDAYCDCMQQKDITLCNEMKNELIKKYEFDPEASSYIVERLRDCVE